MGAGSFSRPEDFAFQVPALGRVGPPLIVATGYLVLGWVERSRTVVGVALALIAATLASVDLDLSSVQSNAILFAIYGLTLLAVGFRPAREPSAAHMSHPTSALDNTVHQRVRLGIPALLSESWSRSASGATSDRSPSRSGEL